MLSGGKEGERGGWGEAGPLPTLLQGVQMSADLFEDVVHSAFCVQLQDWNRREPLGIRPQNRPSWALPRPWAIRMQAKPPATECMS